MTSSIFKLASARMLIGEAIAEIGGRERPDPSGEAAERFERILDDAAPLPRTTPTLESLIDAGLRFGTIYADPPWQYDNTSCRGAAENHYATMTVDAIAALPISQLAAPHAHLHLWTTNAFLFDAPRVMASWGFTYKSCLVWTKPQFGNGNYWRVSHEFLLLGVRGEAQGRRAFWASWVVLRPAEHFVYRTPWSCALLTEGKRWRRFNTSAWTKWLVTSTNWKIRVRASIKSIRSSASWSLP